MINPIGIHGCMEQAKAVDTLMSFPIKVINPTRKHEYKTYMLKLEIEIMGSLKCLHEVILEQLGKEVVKFDLQFDVSYSASHKVCCIGTDDIKAELQCLKSTGKSLWCEV